MADVLTDELDRTARQVRLDHADKRLSVHVLAAGWSDPWCGTVYRTVCCRVLARSDGAILTTRAATCETCLRGGR